MVVVVRVGVVVEGAHNELGSPGSLAMMILALAMAVVVFCALGLGRRKKTKRTGKNVWHCKM